MEHYALSSEVFGAGLAFARIGGVAMLLPGVGETTVPPQIRLGLALLLTFVVYPVIRQTLPPVPQGLDGLVGDLVSEILIGLALGAVIRLFMGALLVSGEVISLQTTLAFSQTTNPTQAQPAATVGSFLTIVGLTMVFATNLHQMFIAAIVKSFAIFVPGKPLQIADFAALAVKTTGETFALGIQLSAPIMAFGLIFNFAAGLIGRVMPQFQIFFAAAPLTLLLGLSVFALGLGMVGLVWMSAFHAFVARLT